ncbi:uncharacterized protein LOC108906934 isoform X2 [Anoplophora glabripennis]|nr:uncharacterized protein LOC108906934 isoform X2 [Anoplophora glabripennis]
MELFRVTQEVHLLFLKLFETYIVVKNEADNIEEIKTLREVLDIICGMSEILSDLNIQSMSDNWKGYTAIVNKFSSILVHSIDLKVPISCLTYQVDKNLSFIDNKDEIDLKLVTQVIKITSFLIKVVLKICDIFWNCLVRFSTEALKFCCTVYSFPVELFRSQGHLSETLILIENFVFKTIEPLLVRLLKDSKSLEILFTENLLRDIYSFGHLNVLNNILRILVSNQIKMSDHSVGGIINAIFSCTSLCFAEFFWECEPKDNIIDSLVLHISATVIFYDEYYGEMESILLKYLLQDHIFASLLAMEIWTLLLCNSTPQLCLSTLINLIQKYQEINFGVLTHRPERIYLKCFIQRIFKMLPNYTKNDFVLRYNPVRSMDCWRTIHFTKFPVQQRLSIEGICMATVEKIEAIGKGNMNFTDIVFIVENFRALSTVNFREIGLDPNNLAKTVLSLWIFNRGACDIMENNIFKYFMTELCKITGALLSEFNNKQLIMVLSQLRILSCNDSFKLLACNFLSILSNNPYENQQDTFIKLHTLVADIICQNLLMNESNVIKQETLEVIQNFAINEKQDVVKNVLRLSKEMHNVVFQYLQRNVAANKFDREYFASLGNIYFQHECIKWKNETNSPRRKKMRYDDSSVDVQEIDFRKKEPLLAEKPELKPSKWCNPVEAPKISDENKQDGNIADAIGSIKGEVKCLVNILKTEKLTAKNASDIRMIANQLLSLL